jgi:hypothetical protein
MKVSTKQLTTDTSINNQQLLTKSKFLAIFAQLKSNLI